LQQSHGGYVKVAQHIAFKEQLDLSPYCSRFAWVRNQPRVYLTVVYHYFHKVC